MEVNGSELEAGPPNVADETEVMPAEFDSGVDSSGQRKTSIIEQCLAWGGEQRLRLILTLSVGGVLLGLFSTDLYDLLLVSKYFLFMAEYCYQAAKWKSLSKARRNLSRVQLLIYVGKQGAHFSNPTPRMHN